MSDTKADHGQPVTTVGGGRGGTLGKLRDAYEDARKLAIREALRGSGGKLKEAAGELGITVAALQKLVVRMPSLDRTRWEMRAAGVRDGKGSGEIPGHTPSIG